MRIANFKQILLRKTAANNGLNSFIESLADQKLYDYVVESLQKMAKQKGTKKPNTAVLDFAKNIRQTPILADMMHDALSHHATRYSAALKSGNKKLAGQHMRQIMKMLHLTDKMINDGSIDHTNGALKADWVDPKPWERNQFQNKSGISGIDNPYKQEHYSTATKGLAREHSTYDYLSQAPHFSYAEEVHGHGHKGAWPLEETHINGKHIDIDHDHKSKGYYEPHPFDSAPIFSYYGMSNADLSGAHHANYENSMRDFEANQMMDFLDSYQERPAGKGKSSPAHAQVSPLDTDSHLARMGVTSRPQQSTQTAASQDLSNVKFNAEIPPVIGKDSNRSDWDRMEKPPVITSSSADKKLGKEDAMRRLAEIKAKKP